MSRNAVNVKMELSHPGVFIRDEIIEPLNLSITKTAHILDVDAQAVSDLISGKASLSSEMAVRVEKAFDVSMDMLLKMQALHDAAQMRSRSHDITIKRYKS